MFLCFWVKKIVPVVMALGLMKYTHRLADHNKVTQKEFFVETAHRKSKGVLILITISPPQPKN
jgi:hypothetical protein